MSLSIESDLKEIFGKFEQKLDRVDRKLDNLQQDMNDVRISLAEQKKETQRLEEKIDNTSKRLEEKIDSTSKRLEEKIDSTSKRLDERIDNISERLEEKIDSLGKRLDNAEFINRGVLIGLIVAILGGAAKLFGFAGNP